MLAQRLASMRREHDAMARLVEQLRASPLAVATEVANEQHYEVSTEFFEYILGPRLKYSCCLFESPQVQLEVAERAMLALTSKRAEVNDGMRLLELGCGWGSLTLWIAENHPACHITAVSNSTTQRDCILTRADQLGLSNLDVITADMRSFQTSDRFDRVLSVEMFEHMRNYALLFERVASWLRPNGKAFVHVFCHRSTPYLFEQTGKDDWMARHFFTGGVMPSEDLFRNFGEHLSIERQWRVNGMHYWRTCEKWLANLDRNHESLLQILRQQLGPRHAKIALQRWRMFFMACAELFRYGGGNEWFVGHYRFERVCASAASLSPGQRATKHSVRK